MNRTYMKSGYRFLPLLVVLLFIAAIRSNAQNNGLKMSFEISIPQPQQQSYKVTLTISGINNDSLILKMPRWMPGYYQVMNYAQNVENLLATDQNGNTLPVEKPDDNSWYVPGKGLSSAVVHYEIKADRKFVAVSFVDNEHAYIAPAATYLYIKGMPDMPATVKVNPADGWDDIATGLYKVPGSSNEFTAPDVDFLYDCPILTGNLEELPPFTIQGIKHEFTGYRLGDFDKTTFMQNLKKVVEAAVKTIGDIPYEKYTFIAIGPGQGGIEHLNNTTISFDGNTLTSAAAMNRILAFIGHEYFHHYNVKRIRPFELGPFDYDRKNRTNQLWVSEGLTVYYEYLILKRAGLIDENTLLSFLEENITTTENDGGRFYQSLAQASYYTWEDGPFGNSGGEVDKSISYYQKGPVAGLFLDFAIRNATENQKSLDDVMRYLYNNYYKEKKRGFTEAEFQQTCETIAGSSLSKFFEYINTTKEFDYKTYLGYAGLKLESQSPAPAENNEKTIYKIKRFENPDKLQSAILKSWLSEN